MAKKSNESATYFAQKKLLGKAHTSNLKVDGEEVIGSNVQGGSSLFFGEGIPSGPSTTLWLLQSSSADTGATVEYVLFDLQALTGTTYDANSSGGGAGSDSGESSQISGVHTYKLVLPSNYQSTSSCARRGNGVFNNGRIIHESLGKIQLVPPYFSQAAPNPYTVKLFKDDSGSVGDEIPLLDNIDWSVDYYNGILFLQDYSASKVPAYAKAFAYVGKMIDEVVSSGSNASGGDDTQVQFNDGGSSLGGDSAFTFNKTTNAMSVTSLSGSLTTLATGKSYLVAGDNVTITSGTDGHVKIAASKADWGASTRRREVYTITGSHASKKNLIISTTDFSYSKHDEDLIDIHLNGMEVISGTLAQVTANQVDYTLINDTTVRFSYELDTSDKISISRFSPSLRVTFNERPSGTQNGSNTQFTLTNSPASVADVQIFINGVLQVPAGIYGRHDFEVTGSTIYFVTASVPHSNDSLLASYKY